MDAHKAALSEHGLTIETFENMATESSNECVVCCEEKADHIILPCGHMCLCETCKEEFKPAKKRGSGSVDATTTCPKCRAEIEKIQKVF